MAKKKNRKKELRRQQKLEIKLLSQEEGELFEQLLTRRPMFVERRQIQHFDEQHEAFNAYAENQGKDLTELSQQEFDQINRLLTRGTFPFPKATQLFRQAMYTPDDSKRAKLLREVLSLKPEHFLAQFHLLLTDESPYSPEYFERLCQFYDKAKQGWKKAGFGDWNYWEARPYLTVLNYAATYFYGEGFLGMAEQVVDFVLSKRPDRLAPDFLHLALSLYNELGRFDKVTQLYQRFISLLPQNKDSLMLHLVLANLLRGQPEQAKKIFNSLTEVNDSLADFFADDDWIEKVLDIEESEVYVPFSEQSLSAALYHLLDFLERNLTIAEYLYQFARDCGGQSEDSDLYDFFTSFNSPLFKNLRFDIHRILFHENLRTLEDFQNITEKELLAIKGIGKKTLETLKENGVVFKNPR